jgi:hypothetical protein
VKSEFITPLPIDLLQLDLIPAIGCRLYSAELGNYEIVAHIMICMVLLESLVGLLHN